MSQYITMTMRGTLDKEFAFFDSEKEANEYANQFKSIPVFIYELAAIINNEEETK